MSAGWMLGVVALCLAVQAFFAASEIALVSTDELKVTAEAELGRRQARLLGRLLKGRDRLLALTLSGSNLATVLSAVMLTDFIYRINPSDSFLAPFLLAPLTVVVGESIPKLLVLRNPLGFARIAARPLGLLSTGLAPLLALETMVSRWLRRVVGVSPEAANLFLRREDLAMLVSRRAATTDHDAILPAERQMISRIFRFSGAEARKAMIPLVQVEAVPQERTLADAIGVVRREGFSRLPVFRERITDIVGVVHVFDLLEAPDVTRPVTDVMRAVSYFPESMPLDQILIALQRTRETMAVIVDEYGGAAGILTLEDLLEEIVGDIPDEHDAQSGIAQVLNRRMLTAIGAAPIAELNARFGLSLPEGDEYASIGGLVVERLGHIPQPGERLEVGDAAITVSRSDARAVREVVVVLQSPLRPEPPPRR